MLIPFPHESARRFRWTETQGGFCHHGFPNLETVIFATFHDGKVLVMECFTKDKNGLKIFTLKNRHLFFGDNDMGELLYASGLTALMDYIGSIAKNQEIIIIPANGGRLQGIL